MTIPAPAPARRTALSVVALLVGCSSSSVPPPIVTSTIARLSMALVGAPEANTAATFPVQLHAYRADGTEFTGAYPAPVTVTLDAGCDFALATSASALTAASFVDPAAPGSLFCPNVSTVPPPPSVTITSGGATLLLGWNGGFVPPNVHLTASTPSAPAASLTFPQI